MADINTPEKKKMNKEVKKILILTLIAGVVFALIAGTSYLLPSELDILSLKRIMRSLEDSSINWRFLAKSLSGGTYVAQAGTVGQKFNREGIYRRINISGIMTSTLEKFGSFPFDRSNYANVINSVGTWPAERRPAVLFFDIFFADKSPNPQSDKALVESFKNYPGVLAEDFGVDVVQTSDLGFTVKTDAEMETITKIILKESSDYFSAKAQAIKDWELNIENADPGLRKLRAYPRTDIMLPELAQNLEIIGVANIEVREDVVRKKPLVVRAMYYTNIYEVVTNSPTNIVSNVVETFPIFRYYPDIVLATTVHLLGSHISNIVIKKGEIVIKNSVYNGQKMDFSIPVDSSYRLAINYKSTPGSGYIRMIPFEDLPRAGLPRDSVVLVGMYALGAGATHDIKLSPVGNMFGIEHIAYALGTVMNRDFIKEIPAWIDVIYIALFTLILALLISRGIRTTVAAGLIAILVPLVIGFSLFFFNIQIATMLPLLSGLIMLISGEIFMLLTEEKERKFIKSTFSSYVNPDLVDILIQNPDMMQLGGQEKEVTILFSDIRGFTTLSEGMTPKELIDFLNIYLTRMTDILMEHKGTLDKYIGDAVMGFWGAPIDLPDHALKACQTCVRMIESLEEFNKQMTAEGRRNIDIGIGLNSGIVTVGNVGSETRKNYTVIGDNVNLASRLEGVNKYYHTRIVISEFTYERVKEWVIVRELDLIRVKGKNKPVKIYELIDVTKWD